MIDGVDWLPHGEEDYGDMVVRLFENDRDNTSFQQEIYDDLMENFFDEVKKVFVENVKNIETRVKALSSDDLARELMDQLRNITKEGNENVQNL